MSKNTFFEPHQFPDDKKYRITGGSWHIGMWLFITEAFIISLLLRLNTQVEVDEYCNLSGNEIFYSLAIDFRAQSK